jgi:hypothetical protein
MFSATRSMEDSRTSILVIMVAGALIGSITTISLQQAFGINTYNQNIFQHNPKCQPGPYCTSTASTSINDIGTSDNNVASEDIQQSNVCYVGGPACSNDASQFLVINGDGNRATLRTNQQNECYNTPVCSNTHDASVGITGNNNQMDGDFIQSNNCVYSLTCTNEGSFISDLPPGNSRSFSITVEQSNHCGLIQSKCTNDYNSPSSGSQKNICFNGSTCANSGSNNLNQCFNGAVCTNTGENTNVRAIGATSCSSGAPGTSTFCEPGKPPIVRP